MNKLIIVALLCSFVIPAWSYDAKLAEEYQELFAPAKGAAAGKALQFMTPEVLIKGLQEGNSYTLLDVRTPGEAGLFSFTAPGSLAIQISELFKKENLDQLPANAPIVVVCKSGARATAAGTALRMIGFEKTYILKGGFQALAVTYDNKQADGLFE